MDFQLLWAQYGKWALLILGFVVLYIVFTIVVNRKRGNYVDSYLKEHPDAARVYLSSHTSVTSESVIVAGVDGGQPDHFQDKSVQGIFLTPGTHNLQVDYSYTRPGVMHKSVTKTTGVVEYSVTVEAGGVYQLGFDRKEKKFTFARTDGAAVPQASAEA